MTISTLRIHIFICYNNRSRAFGGVRVVGSRRLNSCCAAGEGNIEAVKQHLAAGNDVNAKNDYGATPLYIASGAGHKEVVELLIAKSADVSAMLNTK